MFVRLELGILITICSVLENSEIFGELRLLFLDDFCIGVGFVYIGGGSGKGTRI